MPIINGRRIDNIPPEGILGSELYKELGARADRRPIIHRGGTRFEAIQPGKRYTADDLRDRQGRPVKVEHIPDRTKGGFGGARSEESRQLITLQVFDIAEKLFKQGVDFDEANADWMVVPQFRLPPNWHHITPETALLVTFPTEYPTLPPIGFYMKADLPGSANGHLYRQAYHEAWKAPLEHGWIWYCVYLNGGAWQPAPARMWRRGDNLWTYFMLIQEVLGSSGD